MVVGVDGVLITGKEDGANDIPVLHFQQTERAVLIFHGKMSPCVLRDEIDFTRREVGNVR